MREQGNTQPSRLYRLMRLLIVPAFLYYLLIIYYQLTLSNGVNVYYPWWSRTFSIFIGTPIGVSIGYLIMRRTNYNVVGPALIIFSLLNNTEYIFALPLNAWIAQTNIFLLTMALTAFLVLITHFPDGRIFRPWLRIPVYLMIFIMFLSGFFFLFFAPISYGSDVAYGEALVNPFLLVESSQLTNRIYEAGGLFSFVMMGLGVLCVIYRYFNTSTLERKQIRWIGFGLLVVMIFSAFATIFATPFDGQSDFEAFITGIAIMLFDGMIFGSIGFAILFYRLFDIDVIIRRTLVYSIVSLLLILTYFGIVLIVGNILDNVFEIHREFDIVVSTLVVAGLFNPVFQRVQAIIDRIFYRKRYDVDATLEQFSTQLREALEPQTIEQHMLDTVTNTLQPQTISIRLFEPKTQERSS